MICLLKDSYNDYYRWILNNSDSYEKTKLDLLTVTTVENVTIEKKSFEIKDIWKTFLFNNASSI